MAALEKPLFILEMANNHMGQVDHAKLIIREMARVTKDFPFTFAVKLQYRDIATCIHPAFRNRLDYKFVKRFTETALSQEQMAQIVEAIRAAGFVTICTPWDEPSVDLIEKHRFDYIKIPSCYLTDWSLIERIGKSTLPVIASVAAAPLLDIDKVVSFFEHRKRPLMLMHCVGEYFTDRPHLQLNQIDLLRARYPQVNIGYSTHESPDDVDAVKMAVAKGVRLFEKHVGVPTERITLNAYSANPEQVHKWLVAAQQAFESCGAPEQRYAPSELERETLRALHRGAFARTPIKKGERVDLSKVFLAMPCQPGQIVGSDMSKYCDYVALRDLAPEEAVMLSDVSTTNKVDKIHRIVAEVKRMLKQSGVIVPSQMELEISHHYGIDQFDRFGSTTVTVVNRNYCKRVIVLLPGQTHPEQYHQQKDETYHILSGDMTLTLDGKTSTPQINDVIVIERGTRHAITTKNGVIIEEISSSYSTDDSFYVDATINQNKSRKSYVTYWMD